MARPHRRHCSSPDSDRGRLARLPQPPLSLSLMEAGTPGPAQLGLLAVRLARRDHGLHTGTDARPAADSLVVSSGRWLTVSSYKASPLGAPCMEGIRGPRSSQSHTHSPLYTGMVSVTPLHTAQDTPFHQPVTWALTPQVIKGFVPKQRGQWPRL